MSERSKEIRFDGNSAKKLRALLLSPLTSVSLFYPNRSLLMDKSRWISRIILWGKADLGLCISPTIHQLSERIEAGSLRFEWTTKGADLGDQFNVSNSFQDVVSVKKMVVNEVGYQIECGIIIIGADDAKLTVLPNVYPGTLAIKCDGLVLPWFETEYEIQDYQVIDLE